MRLVIAAISLCIIGALVLLYWSGAGQVAQQWALDGQREAQTAMARALRALRAGDFTAVLSLLLVCFGYGFFHAVGPGHGKMMIGGYGAATQIGAMKLSLVALASSLAQGGTAVALVGFGLVLWTWGRAEITDLAEQVFAPLSFAAIALVGLWLVYRGVRGLRRSRQAVEDHAHGHAHDHGHVHHHDHSTCGHVHAPSADEIAGAKDWRDLTALITAVAIRPCTGALFLLILTAQMGIFWIGVAGTFAMALGTASVTIAIAVSAVGLRRGALASLTESATLACALPMLEIGVGAVVAVVAGQFALLLL
ncbi:MAG: hypothetical protein AAGH83_12065 [Pseudomonadota bacterium]